MSNKTSFWILSLYVLCCHANLFSQIVLQGTVTDNGGDYQGGGAEAVVNALVTVTDQADTHRTFTAYTNDQGHYIIQFASTGVDEDPRENPSVFKLFQNYPNPFNPSTVISYELPKPANLRIEIYNALGQRIKTVFDGFQSTGISQIVWDAKDDLGRGVTAGVYICSLISEGIRINRKMVLMDGNKGPSISNLSRASLTLGSNPHQLSKHVSNSYVIQVSGRDIETYRQSLILSSSIVHDVQVTRTVTDIDGNVYKTVKMGSTWWMAENLKVTRYRNGDSIPNVTITGNWSNLVTGAYFNYDNDERQVSTYGRLYNWFAINDPRGLAPEGWHVPRDVEWQTLVDFLGGSSVAGGKMKEAGTSHWNSPNTDATNESGFAALPGGFRSRDGLFDTAGTAGFWWASTELVNQNGEGAWERGIFYNDAFVQRNEAYKTAGLSVRCLKDSKSSIDTLVETSEGTVRGAFEGGHLVFKGIPYASAPIGARRWMPPEEPSKHASTLDALAFCPACPQPRYPEITITSEDCLFLNIWAPATPGPHPVLFWMHGGAFVQNSGAQSRCAGSALAERGVVVVTINYRLGALGIFAHPALTAERPQGPLGNYVLMDQLAALRWVNKNIAAFGGDPGAVTVSGSSAGATSILFLMSATEEAVGLFQKAIMQSGGGIDSVFEFSQEEQAGAAFAKLLGVPTDATTSTAQALRALSAKAITDANGPWKASSTPPLAKKPVVDNVLIHQTPNEIFVPGGAFLAPVAFLIGSADGESGGKTQPQGVPMTSIKPGGAFSVDLDRARAVVATGTKTYLYYFRFVPGNPGDVADHGESVPYTFGTTKATDLEAVRISNLMMDYWLSFMTTGVPTSSGGPTWPAYDPNNPQAMVFANTEEGGVSALPIQQ